MLLDDYSMKPLLISAVNGTCIRLLSKVKYYDVAIILFISSTLLLANFSMFIIYIYGC